VPVADAQNAAAGSTYQGAQGHLATVNVIGENDLIFGLISSYDDFWRDWSGAESLGPWLGDHGESEGVWKWITGEPWDGALAALGLLPLGLKLRRKK